jgi:hypothetical protein
MRMYVLFMRRLYMVPWLHGMTACEPPNKRKGYESLWMLM